MKVGDYVRTDYGTIFKIENMVEIDVDGTWFKSKVKENSIIKDLPRFMYDEEEEIINKSSPNIIDLIEVGDYVNGERVIALEKDIDKRNIYPSNIGAKIFTDYEIQGDWYFGIQEENIKSIVTRERFSQMEYRIGE